MLTKSFLTLICGLELCQSASPARAQPAPAVPAIQVQCVQQAEAAFLQLGGNRDKGDTFLGHYSTDLDKCLARVELKRGKYIFKNLIDAYRLRPYAMYARLDAVKGIHSFAILNVCKLIVSKHKQYNCHSETEYEDFVSYYMAQ